MDKIKWGVLGTASIAQGCTIPGMKMAEHCELTAIAGRSLEKAENFKERFGFEKAYGSYEELLADKDVQAVYIPLPNSLHYEWCMKAMKAGKHVLCEKPLTGSKKEAEELFAAARENGVLLMEAFAYLQSPYVDALKDEIKSGSIGELRYMESEFLGQTCKPTDIRMYKEYLGGAMYDLGCYPISLFLWLMDEKPLWVKGIGEFTENDIDLFSSAYMMFPGNVRALINCGMVLGPERPSRRDQLYIKGTDGYIVSDVYYNKEGECTFTIVNDAGTRTRTVTAKQNYSLEIDNLSRAILYGEPQRVTPEFSIMEAETIDMTLEAIGY